MLISLFYKDHPNKPIATSNIINITLSIARLIIKLGAKITIEFLKQKQV